MPVTTEVDADLATTLPVLGDDRGAGRVSQVDLAPLLEGQEDRHQRPALGGGVVLGLRTTARVPIGMPLEDPGGDQLAQSVRQHAIGHAEVLTEVFEAVHAVDHVPHDQQHPLLAQEVDGHPDRTVVGVGV